ncbi:MAG: hypothetical protein ACUVXF_08630 [Desulfobaccales bacterium]
MSDKLLEKNAAFAEEGVNNLTKAYLQLSEQVLRKYGEFLVEDLANDVARELSDVLKRRKSHDYADLRRDKSLRRLAVQDIRTMEGVAGYTDLIDKHGVSVLHPNPEVEGKNFILWRKEFPEMWQLVERSFTEPHVKGYYTFLDRHNQIKNARNLWPWPRSRKPPL